MADVERAKIKIINNTFKQKQTMKLKAALEYEKLREKGDANKIFLHQDGKFYHAYEYSAWLIKEFAEKQMEDGGLKVSLYRSTHAEYVIGGFPLESLSKFIPDYTNTTPIDEKTLCVEIELPEDCDFNNMKERFEAWRKECPVLESKKMHSKSQVTNGTKGADLGKSGLFSIASRVLSYPIERTTPAQNFEFISLLKQDVSNLL